MRNKELQMSLFDTYDEVLDLMEVNKPELIEIIDEYIDNEFFLQSKVCSIGNFPMYS